MRRMRRGVIPGDNGSKREWQMKKLLVISLVLGVGLVVAGIASASPAVSIATVITVTQTGAPSIDLGPTPGSTMVAQPHRRRYRGHRRRYRVRYCQRWSRRCVRWSGYRRCLRRLHNGRCVRWGGYGRRHCRQWRRHCRGWGHRWRYR